MIFDWTIYGKECIKNMKYSKSEGQFTLFVLEINPYPAPELPLEQKSFLICTIRPLPVPIFVLHDLAVVSICALTIPTLE
jgi:hypothetical protein